MKKFLPLILVFVLLLSTIAYASLEGLDSYADPSGNINIVNEKIPTNKNVFSGNDVAIDTTIDSLVVILGSNVRLNGEYNGDVFVFGNSVTLDGTYNENVFVFAQTAVIRGNFERSLYNFSSSLTSSAFVEKDLSIFASTANLESESYIGRDLFSISTATDFRGNVERNMKHFGGPLNVFGKIYGDLTSESDYLNIEDSADIGGFITYKNTENNLELSPNATIKHAPDFRQIAVAEDSSGTNIYGIIGGIVSIIMIWFITKIFFPRFFNNADILLHNKFLEALALGSSSIILFIILTILSVLINPSLIIPLIFGYIFICSISVYIALTIFSVNIARSFNSMNNLGYFISICFVSLALTVIKVFLPSANFIISLILGVIGIGFILSNMLYSRKKYLDEIRKLPPADLGNFN